MSQTTEPSDTQRLVPQLNSTTTNGNSTSSEDDKRTKSSLAKHESETGHKIDWKNFDLGLRVQITFLFTKNIECEAEDFVDGVTEHWKVEEDLLLSAALDEYINEHGNEILNQTCEKYKSKLPYLSKHTNLASQIESISSQEDLLSFTTNECEYLVGLLEVNEEPEPNAQGEDDKWKTLLMLDYRRKQINYVVAYNQQLIAINRRLLQEKKNHQDR
ncbi:unnamed protein product [Didymodactylos carnosus]|uniref:Uncharacterized protein n=1 Tax=Didymodactylos carnosus TaxID=1234261 RepID=A0A814Y759_9BILA|nr:unnamed protein product [Didymodactylos carnosus]CAF1225344.1 unnamed protein product [Didymodactylos carnosus]CAF3754170.1 unnamed protein product [Didymodactylos carnosus]CAF3988360.1 unnamed protein product [Didymodactylos carnosus]